MTCAPRNAQGGFVLVAAVFLIVVLAGIIVFAARIGETQERSADYTLLELRAFAAADAGIEYGANLAKHGTCTGSAINVPAPALAGFTVQVTCTGPTLHTLTSGMYESWQLDAFAWSGTYGRPDYVAHSVRRIVKNSPPLSEQ